MHIASIQSKCFKKLTSRMLSNDSLRRAQFICSALNTINCLTEEINFTNQRLQIIYKHKRPTRKSPPLYARLRGKKSPSRTLTRYWSSNMFLSNCNRIMSNCEPNVEIYIPIWHVNIMICGREQRPLKKPQAGSNFLT